VTTFDEATAVDRQDETFSLIKGFHGAVLSAAAFQKSLTAPLTELIQDASGREGVTICKLSRARMILTSGLKVFLESYHHWANLDTPLEDEHCRAEAVMIH